MMPTILNEKDYIAQNRLQYNIHSIQITKNNYIYCFIKKWPKIIQNYLETILLL